jgi:hypothetical protein
VHGSTTIETPRRAAGAVLAAGAGPAGRPLGRASCEVRGPLQPEEAIAMVHLHSHDTRHVDPQPPREPGAEPAGRWAEVWRYVYWILLDRGLATVVTRWVAEAAEPSSDATAARLGSLGTARRLALGMAPAEVRHAGHFADDAALLAALPRGQREVLVLRNLLGLGDAEIAVVMGCRRHGLPAPPRASEMFGNDAAPRAG